VAKSCQRLASSARVTALSTPASAASATKTAAQTATPPRRGTARRCACRPSPGTSSHPRRSHARRTRGVSVTDANVAVRKSAKYVVMEEEEVVSYQSSVISRKTFAAEG
jgi:hypothetical protein